MRRRELHRPPLRGSLGRKMNTLQVDTTALLPRRSLSPVLRRRGMFPTPSAETATQQRRTLLGFPCAPFQVHKSVLLGFKLGVGILCNATRAGPASNARTHNLSSSVASPACDAAIAIRCTRRYILPTHLLSSDKSSIQQVQGTPCTSLKSSAPCWLRRYRRFQPSSRAASK